MDTQEKKQAAIIMYLDERWITVEGEERDEYAPSKWCDNTYSGVEGEDLLVLTDSEADELWEEYLDSYIDECILPELPEMAQRYFDAEAWKRDAKHDGRGHSLSSYDGEEHEYKVDGEWIYIYRTG